MKLTIWAEISSKGVRVSMTVDVPDEEVTGDDGTVDAKKAEVTAREYLGNLVEWGWDAAPEPEATANDGRCDCGAVPYTHEHFDVDGLSSY